jgi:hypothetical protein
MGFLQGDTNNLIVDAVLTDFGRQCIARNDGSFTVVKWSASDDEVDYSIIKKFGRTTGKAKIERNTPIFEALTNQQFVQKYKLVSVSNPNLIRLPNLRLTGEGVDTSSSNLVSIGNTTVKRRSITVYQDIQNETSIDVELRDQAFVVDMSNMFLQVQGFAPDNIDGNQRATYIIQRDPGETSVGGSELLLTITTKAIAEDVFQVYGARSNKNLISTFVKITGVQSGAVLEIEVQISKTA